MLRHWVILVLVFAFPQQKGNPPAMTQTLQAGSSRSVQVPPFGYEGEPKCDSSGDVFFQPRAPLPGTVLRISKDGSQSTLYLLPQDYSGGLMDVDVDPAGGVHDLVMTKSGNFVIDFDRDGQVRRTTRLGVPDYLSADHFAVFNDGAIIYGGHPNRLATEQEKGKAYAALLDGSGKLVKEFPGDRVQPGSASKLADGAITIGADGNAYILSSEKVTVISETGEVLRHIPFKKPSSDDSATRLDISTGLLSIELSQVVNSRVTTEYLVIRTNGETVGVFKPSPELGDSAVCFSADDGYTFFKQGSGRSLLINAPLR